MILIPTAWKVSKYGIISGPNTEKYGPEITPHLDTFHAVPIFWKKIFMLIKRFTLTKRTLRIFDIFLSLTTLLD